MSDINKPEILGLIIRFGLISIISYVTVKWIVKQIDPTNKQKKLASIKALDLLKKLGVKDIKKLNDYEMVIASHLVDPESISVTWDSIAGLEQIIQELKETVILPIKRKDLFANSLLTRAPKGVLLYGPPGCGKTMIAKATAKEAGTRFINLDVSILTDKWYGESQKLASAVFSLALKLQPCIIFIDEIDSFLRKRNSQDHEATAMMKAQFMSLWDGLITDPNCTVILMGATNRQQDLDRAILRRMPATFHVPLPNTSQRKQILELILRNEPTSGDVDINELANMTLGFSGSDLRELCRNASVYRVRDYMRTSSKPEKETNPDVPNCGTSSYYSTVSTSSSSSTSTDVQESLRAITMDDLVTTHSKMRESKLECGTLSSLD